MDQTENPWNRLTRLASEEQAREIVDPDCLSFEAIATSFASLHPLPSAMQAGKSSNAHTQASL